MNKIYRLIWSDARKTWLVAHESATARGKPSRAGAPLAAALAGMLASFSGIHAAAQPPAPGTLPTGGQVIAGQAAIRQSGNAMTIQQDSAKAILNWNSFSIGSQASVNFQQPSSGAVALNRVLGSDPSAIYGSLTANGQVFLVNPSGVVFGAGARVDVGGMVASTLNIRNEDFLSGSYRFSREGSAGSVLNQGELLGRYVALLAPEVRNEGVIVARQGTAALAAGDAVTLNIAGSALIGVQVDQASIDALVENRRLIQADDGTVILSAQAAHGLVGKVVNSGVIEAGGIVADGGTVRLVASSAIEHSGAIRADAGASGRGGNVTLIADLSNPDSRTVVNGSISARGGRGSGDGGFIETSATHLSIADAARIDTTAANGRAGQWLLDPFDFTVAALGGDITGTALSTALGTSNVTIQTLDTGVVCTSATCGSGTDKGAGNGGDIFVNDAVTWNSNKTLTLSAWRNVAINAPVNVNGAGGGLALEIAQSADTASFPSGTYTVNSPVNLAVGAAFSVKTATDGTPVNYTVIHDATALANIAANLAGSYVLGGDVAAPVISWAPLGSTGTPFTGNFDGLGHKITGLVHTNGGADVDVGLFGGSTGLIQNVGVTGVNIDGSQNVGALVGFNNGFVVNSYSTGTVTGSGAGSVGRIGGLVGFSMGPIQASHSDATVTANVGDQAGDPMAQGKGGIGGLAGVVGTAVTDSYARGAVTGDNAVGGLAGYSAAGITNSYSTGAVAGATPGSTNVNGLVGQVTDPASMIPFIFGSFWDTQTSGQATGGGSPADSVTGLTTAQMKTPSFYTSAGWDTAAWELRNGQYPMLKQVLQPIFVYATNTTTTYSGLAVTSAGATVVAGAATGADFSGSASSAPTTTATNVGTYTLTPSGLTLTDPASESGFRIVNVDGTLTITKAHLTVTADNQTRLYGQANPTFTQTVSGFVNGENATTANVTGSAAGSSAATTTTGVGTSTITASAGTLSAANYDFPTLVNGTLTINKAHLTVTADNQTRLYGQANPAFTQTISGFVNGENATSAAITGSAAGSSTAGATTGVGTAAITAGAGTLSAANYDFPTLVNGTLTINKAHLTVTADNQTRLYGQANPTFTQTVSGFVNGENATTANVTGSAAGSSAATTTTGVGTSTITASAGTLSAANYDFPTLVNGTLTINKAHLTVTADNQTRLFGQANPAFTQTLSGFLNGENATSANVTGFAMGSSTANAATAVGTATITASAGSLSASNYDFPTLVNGTLTINAAPAPAAAPATANTSTTDATVARVTEQAQNTVLDATKNANSATKTALLNTSPNATTGGTNGQANGANLVPVNGGSSVAIAAATQKVEQAAADTQAKIEAASKARADARAAADAAKANPNSRELAAAADNAAKNAAAADAAAASAATAQANAERALGDLKAEATADSTKPKDRTVEVKTAVDAMAVQMEALARGLAALGAALAGAKPTPEQQAENQKLEAAFLKAQEAVKSYDSATQQAFAKVALDKFDARKTATARSEAEKAATDAAAASRLAEATAAKSALDAKLAANKAARDPSSPEKAAAALAAAQKAEADAKEAAKAVIASAKSDAVLADKVAKDDAAQSKVEVGEVQLAAMLSESEKKKIDKVATDKAQTAVTTAVSAALTAIGSQFSAAAGIQQAAEAEANSKAAEAAAEKESVANEAEAKAKETKREADRTAQNLAEAEAQVKGSKEAPEKAAILDQIKSLLYATESISFELSRYQAGQGEGGLAQKMLRLKDEMSALWQGGRAGTRDLEAIKADLEKAKDVISRSISTMSGQGGLPGDVYDRVERAKMAADPNKLTVIYADQIKMYTSEFKKDTDRSIAKADEAKARANEAAAAAAEDRAKADKMAEASKAAGASEELRAAAAAAAKKAEESEAASKRLGEAAAKIFKEAAQAAADYEAAKAEADRAAADSAAARLAVAKAEADKAARDEANRLKAIEAQKAVIAKAEESAKEAADQAKEARATAERFKAAQVEHEKYKKEVDASIETTAKQAADDEAALREAWAKVSASGKTADEALAEAKEVLEAQGDAYNDYRDAQDGYLEAAQSLGDTENYFQVLGRLINKEDPWGVMALAKAKEEYEQAKADYAEKKAAADKKREEFDKANAKAMEDEKAYNALAIKAAKSRQAAEQAKLNKQAADHNEPIYAANAKATADNAKAAEDYAAAMQVYVKELTADAGTNG